MKSYNGILKNNKVIDIFESVKGRYYAHLKAPKQTYASIYYIEHDTREAWNMNDKATEIYRKLIKQFNKDEFVVLSIHMVTESFRKSCLLSDIDSSLIYKGEVCVGTKFYEMFERREQFTYFAETRFNNFKHESIRGHALGIMILFKNKADQVVTELTNCFGVI